MGKKINDVITQSRNFRFLESIVNSLFVYDGLPDTVDIDFINYHLNRNGYIVWCKVDGDVVTLQGAISGLDLYNRPTTFYSANPVTKYNHVKRQIGKDCVVLYNTLNKRFAKNNLPILYKYTRLLDNIDNSIDCSIFNTKASTIYNVDSETDTMKIKLRIDKIANGEPFILANTKKSQAQEILTGTKSPTVEHIPVKNNYVLDLLLRDRYTIFCNFLTELGVNSTPFEKKERQIESEVNSNNELLGIVASEMLKAREQAIDEVNKMFGTNISVKFNREEIESNVELDTQLPADSTGKTDETGDGSSN